MRQDKHKHEKCIQNSRHVFVQEFDDQSCVWSVFFYCFRGMFIIDGKGIIRQITINDLPVGRSVDEALRLVQAFQYTDIHGEGTTTFKTKARRVMAWGHPEQRTRDKEASKFGKIYSLVLQSVCQPVDQQPYTNITRTQRAGCSISLWCMPTGHWVQHHSPFGGVLTLTVSSILIEKTLD